MDVDSFAALNKKKRKHWQFAISELLSPTTIASSSSSKGEVQKHAKIAQFISAIWKLAPRPALPAKRKRLRWYDSWHTLEASDTEQHDDDDDPDHIEECESKTNKMVDY